MDTLPNLRSAGGARRFRPRLLPTVAMIVVVVLTVQLGNWQARRAQYKAEQQRAYDQALAAPPLELAAGPTAPAADLRYRPASARGQFVASAQMLIDNRVHDGRVGYAVLTPLVLAGSTQAVLVNRGWVPVGRDRHDPPRPAVPAGSVRVVGRLDVPPPPRASTSPEGPIWQRVDFPAMAARSGLVLLPVVLDQTEPAAAGDDLPRAVAVPDLRIEVNRSYMVQWYSLAALAVVLWLVLNWRRDAAPRHPPAGDGETHGSR